MQDSCNFFSRQIANKNLETLVEVLYYKNIFIIICYITEYIFRISIFNDF